MNKTQAIIPAAGVGSRLKASRPKALVRLNGKPIFSYCLEILDKSALIDSIIVLANEESLKDYSEAIHDQNFCKEIKIIPGGKTRAESVNKGLEALDRDTKYVVIHDAARPLLTKKVLEQAINVCYQESAVIVAVPVKPTIKRVNSKKLIVEETIDRGDLWEVQTPQVFKKDLIIKAHQKIRNLAATDDALLVEKTGATVKVIRGQDSNIKITTREDLLLAEIILNQNGSLKAES